MLAVWLVTFAMLGVAEFEDHFCDGAGLESIFAALGGGYMGKIAASGEPNQRS
jgi:hypothetical protein